jgi:calcium-dependent protein kinase
MIHLKDNAYQYTTSNLLGAGTFGNVFKCVRTDDKKDFALKAIDKAKLQQHGEYLFEALEREIATQTIATQSGIPFFVGLFDKFEDEKTIYMVMELCEKSLTKHLTGIKLSEEFVLDLIYQVGLGLDYLHSIGICHRDIKTENILVKNNVLKIADFGFATKSSMMNTHLGTKPYMAPEFFASEDDEEYTTKVDVWALNTCLYYVCAKKFYFYSHNPKDMERQIMQKEFIIEPQSSHLSKATQELLKLGYQKNPSKRLTMREYINHPAFDKVRKNYMNYPPNCPASASLGDMSFDSLKLEQRLSLDMNQLAKLTLNILNFRNNLLLYSRLAKTLEVKQFSKVFIFLLVKKHMQHLALAVSVLRNGEVPTFGPFGVLQIDANVWSSFLKSQSFGQVGAVMWSDLRKLGEKLPQLYKNMLNAGRPDIEIPNIDLNVECKGELVEYCLDLNDKIRKIVANRPSPDLEKLGKMVQLIVQYERVDPGRLVLGYNNIEE